MASADEVGILVSWVEVTRDAAGNVTHLHYGRSYPARDEHAARALYVRALNNRGWVPPSAHEVKIELAGVALDEALPSPDRVRGYLEQMRAAVAAARGPLAKELSKAVGR